jgi:hypothetical protein
MYTKFHEMGLRLYRLSWVPISALLGGLSLTVLLSSGWDLSWRASAILWFSLSAVGPALLVFTTTK